MSDLQLVFTTFGSEDEAKRIILTLVEERLIACGNITSRVTSIYRWKGKISSEIEWAATLKTTEENFPVLSQRLKELHPYDVPEIVAIPVSAVSPDYAAWVTESCKK
ncbi:MAG: divalent-cation tolerance protein CutA [Chthoniobacterales bacterium]